MTASNLTRRAVLSASAATVAIMAPAAALAVASTATDPLVALVADYFQAEKAANDAANIEEEARLALPEEVDSPRVTVAMPATNEAATFRTIKEIDDAFAQERWNETRWFRDGFPPKLRAAFDLNRRLGPSKPAPAACAAAAEYDRLYTEHFNAIRQEHVAAEQRTRAALAEAQKTAEAEKHRLGFTAIHERTEAAFARYYDISDQIAAMSATTLPGLAARLRYLASISLEGSVPDEDLVVSIADDAERLARGALA